MGGLYIFGSGRLRISPSLDHRPEQRPPAASSNEDGSVWVIFNGEIYNYRELRKSLTEKGHTFKTQTDTEVIVHLYEEYGDTFVQQLAECLASLSGMIAKNACLSRGIAWVSKPLYYYLTDKCLVFASEIKAILADPEVTPEINAALLLIASFTVYFMAGDETLLKNVSKLAPRALPDRPRRKDRHPSILGPSFSRSACGTRFPEG